MSEHTDISPSFMYYLKRKHQKWWESALSLVFTFLLSPWNLV